MRLNLEQVLDLKRWEAVQESIALATHLAIVLVDYRGNPVTRHSQVKPFCQLAREHPQLSSYCEKCDARGGIEAVRSGQTYIYRCHFDIVDMAIPIMVDDNYVGAIMAGEIKTTSDVQLEQVLTVKKDKAVTDFLAKHQELLQAYPILNLDELQKSANMLEVLSEYIVTEAISKDYLVRSYQQTLHITNSPNKETTDKREKGLENIQMTISRSLLETRLNQNKESYLAKNNRLQPAFDAIFANKQANLRLEHLARLVNLSPNYLSRLMTEELGISFTTFYRDLKIDWAKELLETSDWTISEISDGLGYVEPSYFVRLFKQQVGDTPLKYRQKQKNPF